MKVIITVNKRTKKVKKGGVIDSVVCVDINHMSIEKGLDVIF